MRRWIGLVSYLPKIVFGFFLKGPVIAHEIYGDISLRTSKDLDILVQEIDLEKAEGLLFSLGYKREEVPTILNEKMETLSCIILSL